MTLDAVVQSDVDKELLSGSEESVKTVNLMPEYLVVCCWRSIKEVSLLLGQLTQTAPLRMSAAAADDNAGILSVRQVRYGAFCLKLTNDFGIHDCLAGHVPSVSLRFT